MVWVTIVKRALAVPGAKSINLILDWRRCAFSRFKEESSQLAINLTLNGFHR